MSTEYFSKGKAAHGPHKAAYDWNAEVLVGCHLKNGTPDHGADEEGVELMAVITDDEERSLLGHILEAHRPELEYTDIDWLKPSQEKAPSPHFGQSQSIIIDLLSATLYFNVMGKA